MKSTAESPHKKENGEESMSMGEPYKPDEELQAMEAYLNSHPKSSFVNRYPIPLYAQPDQLYLENCVLPLLLCGLRELAKIQPPDPLGFLGAYLLSNNPQRANSAASNTDLPFFPERRNSKKDEMEASVSMQAISSSGNSAVPLRGRLAHTAASKFASSTRLDA
ncbi:unnamed protein product [Phytomonas sp. Hart1]|nr:unnamed protein product [Phytomonas sp. Hart1]|eukprot:CCW69181.1 unnamed protein product [Phytomonas sp. isolate Hart1]